MGMTKRDKAIWHEIDVYGAKFCVVVSNRPAFVRNRPIITKFLHKTDQDVDDAIGFCDYYMSKVGVFLDRRHLKHDLIAHEVFHATHRMLDWAGVRLGKKHAEAHAHLCGYLTKLVYADLRKWREKIK